MWYHQTSKRIQLAADVPNSFPMDIHNLCPPYLWSVPPYTCIFMITHVLYIYIFVILCVKSIYTNIYSYILLISFSNSAFLMEQTCKPESFDGVHSIHGAHLAPCANWWHVGIGDHANWSLLTSHESPHHGSAIFFGMPDASVARITNWSIKMLSWLVRGRFEA